MRAYVAVTDGDWYRFLKNRPDLDEINFWQPGGNRVFNAVKPGGPFLFKLHYPDHYIVGGGFFAHSSILPSSLAWNFFGDKNGAPTFEQMRERIEKYRRIKPNPQEDYKIGCIILEQPFFWTNGTGSLYRRTLQRTSYKARDMSSVQVRERNSGNGSNQCLNSHAKLSI